MSAILIFLMLLSCKTRQKTIKIDETKDLGKIGLDFPFDALGYWEGILEIYSVDSLVQSVNMSIHIEETSDNQVYSWQITYNPGENEDQRNYLLLIFNKMKGHYKIDEDNGIVLDAFLLNNKLVSDFEVQGTRLKTINTFLGEKMIFEVYAGPIKEINITGDMKVEDNVIPPVKSFNLTTYQRAVLKRIRG